MIVQIGTKCRGSFNTLAFGEIKPYIGSLKDGRLDLVYYRDPDLEVGDQFPVWTLRSGSGLPPSRKAFSFAKATADEMAGRTSASSVEPLSSSSTP